MKTTQPARTKVYIVDDEDSIRRALGRLMRSAGLDCESFATGEEFLNHLPAGAQGCLVLDIRMPELTGHDVMARLRHREVDIPVIALSAQDDTSTRERARELGAVAFFRKPVDDQALLDAILWAMDRRVREA